MIKGEAFSTHSKNVFSCQILNAILKALRELSATLTKLELATKQKSCPS